MGRLRSEHALPIVVLLVMLAYSYAYLIYAPYPGFSFDSGNWLVDQVFVGGTQGSQLRTGDRLIQIGPVTREAYTQSRRVQLFVGANDGDVIPLILVRDGAVININWIYPGMTAAELRDRLLGTWWLAYVFFFFGTATLLFLRPKDRRWALLVAFNYLTALWIVIGISSQSAIWQSAILYRMVLWMAIPVYIHLHWEFPNRLGRLPQWLVSGIYAGFALLAALQWFELVSSSAVYLAFALGMVVIGGLLLARRRLQPAGRRTLGLIVVAAVLGLLPLGVLSLLRLLTGSFFLSAYALAAFPILPGAYFYAAYRRQLGGLEFRVNRAISFYLFLILLGILEILALSLLALNEAGEEIWDGLALPLLASLLILLFYPRFERTVEQRLLGIPTPPVHLLESYTARISTSLDIDHLVQILRDEVAPALLIRQSALLCYDDAGQAYTRYVHGVDLVPRPDEACLTQIWEIAGRYRSLVEGDHPDCHPLHWVRLVLPLQVGSQKIGLWLLGRRDPDDFYSQAELPTLQALANQTAIALLNKTQAERLSRLYQADIDRQEAERIQLALELHDGVLNQMAILAMTVEDGNAAFETVFKEATTHIREIIGGLRPTMLSYGLRTALDELADEAPLKLGSDCQIRVELPPSDVRYSPQVELHLYRIVQEACQNAMRHAQAREICITGRLDPDGYDLTVADDGKGFDRDERLELDSLLAHKHYGLAGMIERANLIGARMEISSTPGAGTRVRVYPVSS